MNLAASAPWWLITLLLLMLVAAGIEDATRLRISNWTCGLVVILAILAMALLGFPINLWQNVLVCLAILAIGTVAFAAGLFGGGDIKLLAATGLWLNIRAALLLVIATVLAGGLLALIYLIARKFNLVRVARGERSLKVPYGLAIVAGALVVLSSQFNATTKDPVLARLGVAKQLSR